MAFWPSSIDMKKSWQEILREKVREAIAKHEASLVGENPLVKVIG